jgi:hypothetical protein
LAVTNNLDLFIRAHPTWVPSLESYKKNAFGGEPMLLFEKARDDGGGVYVNHLASVARADGTPSEFAFGVCTYSNGHAHLNGTRGRGCRSGSRCR